ncbi:MAG TPA: hypothetical protein PKV48_06510 [Thermodesulfobacteriota bacterium]|mgnify:CR=1 FL=1|nr:hypothetical protein [Thermodesulfobacteriota bacterium]
MSSSVDLAALRRIVNEAKKLARQYRALTGKPLGITGEVGEVFAADLLGLELAEARCPGYDATDGDGRRFQIKTRCVLPGSKPGQRVGRIKFDHPWDEVLLSCSTKNSNPLKSTRQAEVRSSPL